MNAEQSRLEEARTHRAPWKLWGPYLSERQWGTVREDYSKSGDAWNYFTHDQARSRAYRWGEDGLAGICDERQRLCFALSMWNGQDPIVKERLFGLTNAEGNHGEDVKEYYFYLDSTPTHSYMRYLYKYPQAAYPYDDLVRTNRTRGLKQPEYELLDTGVFDQDRYFDVFVEYAEGSPEDVLIRCTVHNRGADPATLHLLPRTVVPQRVVVARRREAALAGAGRRASRPGASSGPSTHGWARATSTARRTSRCSSPRTRRTRSDSSASPSQLRLREGRDQRLHRPWPGRRGEPGEDRHHRRGLPPPDHRPWRVPGGASTAVGSEPTTPAGKKPQDNFGEAFERVFDARRQEADEFYAAIIPAALGADGANVMRQALAGMLWSKQHYRYDVHQWLKEHGSDPFNPSREAAPRNDRWHHMYNADVISMPDKWEYPWYAAWDLGFHMLALTLVDPDFSKQQLKLLLQEHYMHPNGQVPAYEWNFSDVNPPVHAFATIFTYRLEKMQTGVGDTEWLKNCFHKLLLNFTWWVNRVDHTGRNVFEGGFLGLDNISVFDRSAPLPTGGYLEQSDGTAWMTLFSQNMVEISAELAMSEPIYAEMTLKFFEHSMWIASAMDNLGDGTGMWDEEDGFFYDVLRLPDGRAQRLKVRSMVGLLPLCAATTLEAEMCDRFPRSRNGSPGSWTSAPSWSPRSMIPGSAESPAGASRRS